MDDIDAALVFQVEQRRIQEGYNDAGWEIWDTNYARFITQIDPDAESIGLFRIGGEIDENSPIYSRFARAFEHSSGKDAMYFKMNENFFPTAAGEVQFTFIYYDDINNSTWEFRYDAGDDDLKVAQSFRGNGSKTWKTETITVTYAVMQGNGPNGADFALVNTDNKDDIFHMIEVAHIGSGNPMNDDDYVEITSPANNEQFEIGEPIKISADASDEQGIHRLRFTIDNSINLYDSSVPYARKFNNVSAGSHTLTVEMEDNDGNKIISDPVTIQVGNNTGEDNVLISSPSMGDVFGTGQDVTVTASAFDNQGVEKIRFRVDGGVYNNVSDSNTNGLYTYTFTNLADGAHSFEVQMKDNQGNRIQSAPVSISLDPDRINFTNENNVQQYKIYPTLMDDKLNWVFETDVQEIQIFNLQGVEIVSQAINKVGRINVSKLKPGIYFVHFLANDGEKVKQVIIKK